MAVDTMAVYMRHYWAVDTRVGISQMVDTMAAVSYHVCLVSYHMCCRVQDPVLTHVMEAGREGSVIAVVFQSVAHVIIC